MPLCISVLYLQFTLQELHIHLNASLASLEPSVTNQVHLAAKSVQETLILRKELKSASNVKKKSIMQVHKSIGINKPRRV